MDWKQFDCVVCDVVGTLIEPKPSVAEAYGSAARRFGSSQSLEEVTRRFRAVYADVERRDHAGALTTNEQTERCRWREIVGRVLDVADVDSCFELLFAHFAEPESWRVFDDVEPFFQALKRSGKRIVLASNFDERLVRIAASLVPLHAADAIVISSAVGFRKPHHRFYDAVIEIAQCPSDRVLFIGDDCVNDLQPARACGMCAALIDRANYRSTPLGVISTLRELL